jgi:hypothetical protein
VSAGTHTPEAPEGRGHRVSAGVKLSRRAQALTNWRAEDMGSLLPPPPPPPPPPLAAGVAGAAAAGGAATAAVLRGEES